MKNCRVDLYFRTVKCNPRDPTFGLEGDPVDHKQHQNEQKGLDLYVNVVNFYTGEWCFKKLYENTKGLHFKHTGYGSMYLKNFTQEVKVYPFQVIFDPDKLPDIT